jgi:DNA-binding transcriptional ArsR family regulator
MSALSIGLEVLCLIRENPTITREEMAERLQTSVKTIGNTLKELRKCELIDVERDGKRSRYFIRMTGQVYGVRHRLPVAVIVDSVVEVK